jgi:hypothetical protein
LQPPPVKLAALADRYLPARSFILHQELGHQRLGEVWVSRLVAEPARLGSALRIYVDLAEDVLQAGLNTLECLATDSEHYRDAVRAHLSATETMLSRRLQIAAPTNRLKQGASHG